MPLLSKDSLHLCVGGTESLVGRKSPYSHFQPKRMVNVMRKIKYELKGEKGAVQIVEATFVFPIMFIILFFLIYMGNAHYIKAQVEAIVEKYAIEGANYCADPMLETIKATDSIPSLSSLKTEPYRYIFGGMNEIEKKIDKQVENEISGKASSFFNNMKPKLNTRSRISKFNNYVVYSTFSVEVEYTVEFPIKFLGSKSPSILTINARAEEPVNDVAEFIRNTDMVMDLFHGTKIGQKISDVFGKVNDFISSFANK